MGVLAIVFGGLQVLMTGVGLITQPYARKVMGDMGTGRPDVEATFERLLRDLKLYQYLMALAMLAFAITLIFIGVMLYKRRPRSRPLTIAWAVAALAYLPVHVWVHVKLVLPRSQELTKAMMQGMDNASAEVMQDDHRAPGRGGPWCSTWSSTRRFPLLLLWLIGRNSAKNDLLPTSILVRFVTS
jgi:hypothetical protein